jgi:flagellum-specific ATP synthase
MVATYKKVEDMINIGAYKVGTNKKIDLAIGKWDAITTYFRQGIHERSSLQESLRALHQLVG